MAKYSANEELQSLAKSLNFECKIFDDNSGIQLLELKKNADIDAILLHKNVPVVVSINAGREKASLESKARAFANALDSSKNFSGLKFKLLVPNKFRGESEEKKAKSDLDAICDKVSRLSKNHDIVFRKLFFAPNIKLDDNFIASLLKKGVFVVDKDIYDYFEILFSRLGSEYQLYEFLHFLDIKKVQLEKKGFAAKGSLARTRYYPASKADLEKEQIMMYSAVLNADEIRAFVTVLRVANKYDKKGFQRMIREGRLEKINSEYLEKNYTFPNNIIIALNPNFYSKEKDFWNASQNEICFFDEYNSMVIIDGQHRYFSLITGEKEDRPVLVTFLFFRPTRAGSTTNEYMKMERMFYKINKTQERIDPNLSFIIEARIDPLSEANFWHAVFVQLDKKSFFAGRFSFREVAMRRKGDPKSIVSVITKGGVLQLNKEQKKSGKIFNGLEAVHGRQSRAKNIAFATKLFANYFAVVEEILAAQKWAKEKVGVREIGALIRVIRHFIHTDSTKVKYLGQAADLSDMRSEADYFRRILGNINFPMLTSLDFSASNWAAIEGYILKEIHKKEPKFGTTDLLSKKGKEVYDSM